MSTTARWRAVPRSLVDDEPMLRHVLDELEAELAADVQARGNVLVSCEARIAGPRIPLSIERRRSWLERLMRRPRRFDELPGPYLVMVEGQVLDVIAHQLPLSAQLAFEDGPDSMRAALGPHLTCAGGTLDGLTDAGGYRTLTCRVHGEVWRRGESG